MLRPRRAILLLTLWLATFFAGPVLPAFASPCGLPTAPAACPMQHGASKPTERKTCCCCSPSGTSAVHAMAHSPSDIAAASPSVCDCSVQQGLPTVPSHSTEAPLPSLALALSETPISAVVPPLAHLTADAPLPPFAARLRLPQRALDTGRAPPTA